MDKITQTDTREIRIISLLPAATEIVCALGLRNQLYGISHECHYPQEIKNLPIISMPDVNYDVLSSKEIDDHVEKQMKEKKSLYQLDRKKLEHIRPTHILTQALCDVCAITPSDIQKVIKDLDPLPEVIQLNPRSLQEICDDITRLGDIFDKKEKAQQIVDTLQNKMNSIRSKTKNARRKTIFCVEWIDPLYACGHWVPEMVEIAGGVDPLSFPNEYSTKISWDKVAKVDPEILIIMACSFTPKKAQEELQRITHELFWKNLSAVKHNQVWVVDGAGYFNQSGIRTIDNGIEILVKIIHPEVFGKPRVHEAVQIVQ